MKGNPIPIPLDLNLQMQQCQAKVDALEAEKKESRFVKASAQTVRCGTAYLDDVTGLIFTPKDAHPDRSASVVINFPDRDTTTAQTVIPGEKWEFKAKGKSYSLILMEVNFIGD